MRDKIKDKEYFKAFTAGIDSRIKSSYQRFVDGKIPKDRVPWFKLGIFDKYLFRCVAEYSLGNDVNTLTETYRNALDLLTNGGWITTTTKVNIKPNVYKDQYTVEPHGKMLRMLSLGYLLNMSDQDFRILVDKIDQDNISDNLYEFIIQARFPDRVQKRPEEYNTDQSVILKVYDKLRKATEQGDEEEASKLVKQFLEKDFYHKHSGFYNSHKSKANTYYGYWSFEAAAVVKIMGLDDSSFIDNQYYPKDLVHQS